MGGQCRKSKAKRRGSAVGLECVIIHMREGLWTLDFGKICLTLELLLKQKTSQAKTCAGY